MSRLRRYGLIGNQPTKVTAADKPTGVLSIREINEEQSQGNYYYSSGKVFMLGYGSTSPNASGTLVAYGKSSTSPLKYTKINANNTTAGYSWSSIPSIGGVVVEYIEWTKDGRYVAIGASDAVYVYKFVDGVFTLILSDTTASAGLRVRTASWSDDGQYLVSGSQTTDNIKFYRITNDTVTYQTNGGINGQALNNAKMSPDGVYCISMANVPGTGMKLLKRTGDNWVWRWSSATGATAPGSGSPIGGAWIDNTTFVIYCSGGNVSVYTRSGDVMVKTAITTDVALTTAVAGNSVAYGNSCILLRQNGKTYVLFSCYNADPWVTVYEYTGSALVKQTGLTGSTGGPGGTETVYGLACTTDGMLVASCSTAGATPLARPIFYNFNNGTLTPITSQVLNGSYSSTSGYPTYSVAFQP